MGFTMNDDSSSISDTSDVGTQEWLKKKTDGLRDLKALFFDPKAQKLSEHFVKFDKIISHLWCIGMAFDDSDIVCQLLLSLPRYYESVVFDCCSNGIPPMEMIQAKLLLKEVNKGFIRTGETQKKDEILITLDAQDKNDEACDAAILKSEIKSEPCVESDDCSFDWEETKVEEEAEETKPLNDALTTDKLEEVKSNSKHGKKKIPKKRKHKQRKYQERKNYECDTCGKVYKNREKFSRHIKSHITDIICKRCHEKFDDFDDLRKHRKTVHAGDTEICKFCKKVFPKYRIYSHLLTHSETNHLCPVCGKSYKNAPGLQYHMDYIHSNVKHNTECTICGKTVLAASIKVHMILHEDKKYLCTLCGKSFHWKSSLLTHMKDHGQQLAHQCQHCDSQFVSKNILDRHMRRHTGVKPFSCEECNKSFTVRTSLKRHKEVIHGAKTGVFPCEVCGVVFNQRFNLKSHMRKHSGPENNTCGICWKAFMSPRDLQAHLKSHAGESLFDCKTCDLGFPSKRLLNKHLSSDTHLLTSAGVS